METMENNIPSATHQEKAKKMKKLRRWQIAVSLLGVAIIVWGVIEVICLFLNYSQTETSNDAQIEQYVSPINLRASGYIDKIYFTEHQEVRKGDTLLVLDDREYKIRVMEAEAALKDAQAGATVINATLNTTQTTATVYDASIAEIEVRLAKLEKDRKRYENLVERKAATPIQLEQIVTDYEATRKKLEADEVKKWVKELPQTYLAFVGSSGKSVKIWVRFTYPDDLLPVTREQAELFHAHAYRLAVKFYQPQLPFHIELKEPSLEQYCRLTFDPELYFNPESMPIYMKQPASMPGETTYREQVQTEASPLQRLAPGYESHEALSVLFEAAFARALEEQEEFLPDGDIHSLLVALAGHCFRAGIPEEDTVRWSRAHYHLPKDDFLIRETVKNVYRSGRGFADKSSLLPEQIFVMQMDEFMKRRYEFRFNQLTTQVECRERNTFNFYFHPVDKRQMASITMNAQYEGLKLWDKDVVRYLNSDHVPVYQPAEEFLYDLPHWDGKDHIGDLAKRVPCDNPHWPHLFRRWFLSMVAHWRGMMRKNYANSTSPILVGPQAYRKSTFCRLILPPCLQAYYTDSIDFSRKRDAELYLNRFLLINMDEFDQISIAQQPFLKHILQKPVVNTRRPNASAVEELRRYASFIGTSNHKDLLTDTSGSRRYIAVEVTGVIDVVRPIDYEQLYAQAMAALYKNERYWFDERMRPS